MLKKRQKEVYRREQEEGAEMKAKGGRIAAKGEHTVQKQSKRGAKIMTMCGGGGMGKAKKYARGGGIEVKGKTKGKMC